ncbi:MAG: inverse autotransporter beta domain-containing protein [Rhodobacter sp.]|nr:inverse autotransporter beta domain-containing protein [Rhodobacter sp.]
MQPGFFQSTSRVAIICCVFGALGAPADAQTANGLHWGPRGEVGGYGGDSALTRGEVGLFFPFYQESDRLVFGDLRGRFFDGGVNEGNAAIGYRQRVGDRIYGAWIGYDGRTSDFGNYFDQIAGGIEVLNPNWEFRLNGYLPLTDTKRVSSSSSVTTGPGSTPTLSFVGSQLFLTSGGGRTTTTVDELAMYGVDVEFGVRVPLNGNGPAVSRNSGSRALPKHDLRLYGGAFYFDHDDFAGEIAGVRARAEWRVNDVIAALPGSFAAFDVAYQYDDVRDGLFQAGLRLNVPLGRKRSAVAPDRYDPLMTGFIQRDPNVVTRLSTRTRTTGTALFTEPVNDALTGTELNQTIFVGSGDLQTQIDDAGANSHIVVTDGAAFTGAFDLPDDVTFQGAGTDLTVRGRTSGRTAVYSEAGTTPTLTYLGVGPAGQPNLTVGSNTHVLGFNIVGEGGTTYPGAADAIHAGHLRSGNDGIQGRTNASNTFVRRVNVSDTGGDGIDFTLGGTGINIFNTDIFDAHGHGLALVLNNATVNVANVNIQNAGDDGVSIMGTPGDSSVLNFSNVTVGLSADSGIDILDAGGTFTFANTDISGTSGGEALSVRGGDAAITFDANSSVAHNSDPAAVRVAPGSASNTGSLAFDGVVNATAGIGLEFIDANGTYDFNGQVTLSGGNAGIDILGDSAGTFTFANTSIADPAGIGLNIDGGSADVNFNGSLSQTNNASAVSINNHSTGTLSFAGTIDATNGDGLQFNDADGTYNFNGQVTLSGGDAGIDILGGSAGTFTFTNTDITDPSGAGLHIQDSDATVNFGVNSSITQSNNAETVSVNNHMGGTLTFDGLINGSNGTGLVFSEADGTYNFNGTTSLTNSAGIVVGLFFGTSSGTFTFGENTNVNKNFPVGAAVEIFDFDGLFNYNGSIEASLGASPFDIINLFAGGEVNFNSTGTNSIVGNDTPGDALGGPFLFGIDGSVLVETPMTLNNTDFGLTAVLGTGDITFVDTTINATDPGTFQIPVAVEDISGTVTFTNLNVTTNTNQDVAFLVRDSGTLVVNGDSNIFATGETAVEITDVANLDVTFNNVTSIDALQLPPGTQPSMPAPGILIENVGGGTFDVTGTTTITNPEASGIDIIDSSGTFTFANVDITDTGEEAIDIMGGDATVNILGGSIMQSNNASTVSVVDHMTGTVSVGASIDATNGDGLQFSNADGTYTFDPAGTDTIVLDGTSNAADTGIDILGGSAGTFTFAGEFGNPIQITNDQGSAINIDGSPGTVNLQDVDIDQAVGAGVLANDSGALNILGIDIDNTTGDGINVTNTNLDVEFASIGVNAQIGDDGIQIVNNDGTDRTASIINSNIFELTGTGIANRGIFIESSGTGSLEADVRFNTIASTNQAIQTTSGTTAGSLILLLQNSPITTDTPGVFTQEHTGGGLHSTIVRSFEFPNQVIGAVVPGTAGGGILFDQVTFDADGNTGNGFQQVQFTNELTIGTPPPSTTTRVTGNGLSFVNTTGDLAIETLAIANSGGTGLLVDTSGLGTSFNLDVGSGTIDTLTGSGIVLDGTGGTLNFTLNGTDVETTGGFTVETAGTSLDGSGNTSTTFSCNDLGGNANTIAFNGGADTCP